MTALALARDERADLAAFLATLTPEEWEQPSLCEGWRVRDVVVHLLSYEDLDRRGLVRQFARGWFRPSRVNQVGVAEYRGRTPDELLERLNTHLTPRGLTAGFGGLIGLLDGLIHHQDIRRALGKPREVPAERLRAVLPLAVVAPPIRGFWRSRGLRVVAEDLDWAKGRGPEVRGNGEPLVMAIAGRRGVVDELTGPGKAKLAARIRE
ncbi:maleylpyruvate isomerase family mycothiol-dependent enzyme [Prauserella oleivorans]|uniref:Maleylpyruvate isomerase family mycothiol-dependent enzyme n=1 Tax=Prauserella oleivorans TaxID=1478153 RepID=A0ABW5WDB4_9PSEU